MSLLSSPFPSPIVPRLSPLPSALSSTTGAWHPDVDYFEVRDGGAVGLALTGVAVDTLVCSGALPFGPSFEITAAEGNLIRELDDVDSAALRDDRDDMPSAFSPVLIELDGALYKMVRNMVGAALAVAGGTLPPDAIAQALAGEGAYAARRREDLRVKSAPAHGLCLEAVLYDDYPS